MVFDHQTINQRPSYQILFSIPGKKVNFVQKWCFRPLMNLTPKVTRNFKTHVLGGFDKTNKIYFWQKFWRLFLQKFDEILNKIFWTKFFERNLTKLAHDSGWYRVLEQNLLLKKSWLIFYQPLIFLSNIHKFCNITLVESYGSRLLPINSFQWKLSIQDVALLRLLLFTLQFFSGPNLSDSQKFKI